MRNRFQTRVLEMKTLERIQGVLGFHAAERVRRHPSHMRVLSRIHAFGDILDPLFQLPGELRIDLAFMKLAQSPDRSGSCLLADERLAIGGTSAARYLLAESLLRGPIKA